MMSYSSKIGIRWPVTTGSPVFPFIRVIIAIVAKRNKLNPSSIPTLFPPYLPSDPFVSFCKWKNYSHDIVNHRPFHLLSKISSGFSLTPKYSKELLHCETNAKTPFSLSSRVARRNVKFVTSTFCTLEYLQRFPFLYTQCRLHAKIRVKSGAQLRYAKYASSFRLFREYGNFLRKMKSLQGNDLIYEQRKTINLIVLIVVCNSFTRDRRGEKMFRRLLRRTYAKHRIMNNPV